MAVEIKVPSVGESVSEGSIARWIKNEGDFVSQDEPVFELETEKATQEIPSPASGVLHIKVKAGEKVAIGSVVGSVDEKAAPAKKPVAKQAEPARAETKPSAQTPAQVSAQTQPPAPAGPTMSPAARAVAGEHGVAAGQVTGTGRHGLVTKEDVEKFVEGANAKKQPAAPTPVATPVSQADREVRQPMTAIRQRIAERLVASQKTTASLTTFNEADLSAIMELRGKYKETFQKKHDVGLGFMSFFVKACVEALKAYPLVNARIDGADVVYQNFYNIGVAVSTDKGLMVPVLRDADRLGFAQVEKAIVDVATRARAGKISVTDLQGGTFTITNGGIFGSMLSTPILNPPQSAILGMHAIQKRPVVRDDQIVIRPMMYLALTYDHRIIDGREAVLFLVRVKECLETPERMLLDI
jgi:2-oxoglutarate dehydrogenase E2 component (dihydrolipoamide succinyltransferase)